MHGLEALGIITAIAFAFGERTARVIVGSVLIIGALAFAYVIFRIATGTV